MGGPLLLLAGGSGIAPLRSMIKQNVHGNHNQKIPITIAYSCRTKIDLIYSDEIDQLSNFEYIKPHFFFTRENNQKISSNRINADFLENTIKTINPQIAYVCGSTQFVEAMCSILIKLKFPFVVTVSFIPTSFEFVAGLKSFTESVVELLHSSSVSWQCAT